MAAVHRLWTQAGNNSRQWRVASKKPATPRRNIPLPALWLVCSGLLMTACTSAPVADAGAKEKVVETLQTSPLAPKKEVNYPLLQQKIIYGKATLAEVRQALTEKDTASLTNTTHALYSMRWHRGVFKLLYDLWQLKRDKYPELNWASIKQAPVRIALASTLNRVQIANTGAFQDYIRSFRQHAHEFIRAQVAVALGFNGDPADIGYLRAQASSNNRYVTQSAITALALMGGDQARDALIDLWKKHQGNPREEIILELLREAYSWLPPAE